MQVTHRGVCKKDREKERGGEGGCQVCEGWCEEGRGEGGGMQGRVCLLSLCLLLREGVLEVFRLLQCCCCSAVVTDGTLGVMLLVMVVTCCWQGGPVVPPFRGTIAMGMHVN
jgi:hypothetical protein